MANKPIVPEPGFDFSDFSANFPLQQQPGNELDDEYAQLRQTDRELLAWLEQAIDDDGRLAYQIVEPRNFSSESLLLIDSGWVYRGEWAPATAYKAGDYVLVSANQASYICLQDHTSSADFADDYAANLWGLLFQAGVGGDVYGPPGASANEITVYQDSSGKLIGNSGVQLSALARRDADNYLQGTQFFGAAGAEEALIRAYDDGDGLVLGRIRPGQPDFDFLDGGVLLTDGETRVYGAAVQVAALAGGDGYQVYATSDGYLYPVAPPAPGWSVSDSDTGTYATGAGADLGPWVQLTGLEVAVPEDVEPEDRLIYQIVTQLQNDTTNRTGSVAVGIGVAGAEPTGVGISHTITPGFDGAVITGLSVENQTLSAGTLLSVWFRRVSGDHAQFGVTADGSTNPHSLLVEKGTAGGGSGEGVNGPGSSTAGAVATWSGTTGDLLADSSKLTAQLPQLDGANVFNGASNEFNNPVTQGGEQLIRTNSAAPPTGVKPTFDIIQCTQDYYDGITPDSNTVYLIPGLEPGQQLVDLGTFTPAAGEIRIESILTGFRAYQLIGVGLRHDVADAPRVEFLSGSTPQQGSYYYQAPGWKNGVAVVGGATTATRMNLLGNEVVTAGAQALTFNLLCTGFGPENANPAIQGTVTAAVDPGIAAYGGLFTGWWLNVATFDGIRFYGPTNPIAAGSIQVKGIP